MTSPNSYRVKDIVGFEVLTVQGEKLGALMDVLPTGSNDVFVVGEGKQEVLIPALKTVVQSIDLETKTITVDLPRGLR
jgi:16S rRNA processing protein RimM